MGSFAARAFTTGASRELCQVLVKTALVAATRESLIPETREQWRGLRECAGQSARPASVATTEMKATQTRPGLSAWDDPRV